MPCPHDAAEQDTAAHFDGLCPLCLKAENEQLRASLRDLIAMETDSARVHYARYNRKTKSYDFTDEMWRQNHQHSFDVVKRARALVDEQVATEGER